MKTKFTSMVIYFILLISGNISFSIPTEGLFIRNYGQMNEAVLYYSLFKDYNAFFCKDGSILFDYYTITEQNNSKIKLGHAIKFILKNASLTEYVEEEQTSEIYNFFLGNNPKKWVKGVSGSKKLLLRNVWKNIDIQLVTDNSTLRYNFIVHPGADINNLKFSFQGAEYKIKNNRLILDTRFGEVEHKDLFAYQLIVGNLIPVNCKYEISNDGQISFNLKNYDKRYTLVIDPLVTSSFFGGNGDDNVIGIKEIGQGTVWVCGSTESINFPTTIGAYDEILDGTTDIFLTKLDLSGSNRRIITSTLIGGGGSDTPVGIEIDKSGNIYLAGTTNSIDFPTFSFFNNQIAGYFDVFASKFNPNGDDIIFSTYVGGAKDDIATSFKLSEDNGLYVCGYTTSMDFPIAGNAYQNKNNGKNDIFLFRLSNSGQSLRFSTYFGGADDDFAYSMTVTPSEIVYLVGATKSGDFPVHPVRIYSYGSYTYVLESPYDRTYNGGYDAVVLKVYGNGGGLDYASFFGGVADDVAYAVSWYGEDEKVVFAGVTNKEPSTISFPLTEDAFQRNIKGSSDMFVASLSNIIITSQYGWTYKSQNLIFSTFVGGSLTEKPVDIEYFPLSQEYGILCQTNSSDFPVFNNPSAKKKGKIDACFFKLSKSGTSISFTEFFGGSEDDIPTDLELSSFGDFYAVGKTNSGNFPSLYPIENQNYGGKNDGFILKYSEAKLTWDSPNGNEEICPNESLRLSWYGEGFSSKDTFDIEYKTSYSDGWNIFVRNVVGNAYKITIPDTISGKVWFRVSHARGFIAQMPNPVDVLQLPYLNEFKVSKQNGEICEGDSIIFIANAGGSKIIYQWYCDGNLIKEGNDSVLIVKDLALDNSGHYNVRVKGACEPSVESESYFLEVIPKTKVSALFTDTTVKKGQSLVMKVNAVGKELRFSWYKNGIRLLGEYSDSLTLLNTSIDDDGEYFCIAQGICGSDTSEKIIIKVDTTVIPNEVTQNDMPFTKILEDERIINIHISCESISDIKLVNIYGVVFHNIEFFKSNNEYNISIAKNEFPSGIYFLLINCNNIVEKYKILFLR